MHRLKKILLFFLNCFVTPLFLALISKVVSGWIPSIPFLFIYLFLIFFLLFVLVKIFNIKTKKNQIKTFQHLVIYPHSFWIVIIFIWFLLNPIFYLFDDPTGVCNPPGPDGPNCHLCPKGTTGCGDIYKQN